MLITTGLKTSHTEADVDLFALFPDEHDFTALLFIVSGCRLECIDELHLVLIVKSVEDPELTFIKLVTVGSYSIEKSLINTERLYFTVVKSYDRSTAHETVEYKRALNGSVEEVHSSVLTVRIDAGDRKLMLPAGEDLLEVAHGHGTCKVEALHIDTSDTLQIFGLFLGFNCEHSKVKPVGHPDN